MLTQAGTPVLSLHFPRAGFVTALLLPQHTLAACYPLLLVTHTSAAAFTGRLTEAHRDKCASIRHGHQICGQPACRAAAARRSDSWIWWVPSFDNLMNVIYCTYLKMRHLCVCLCSASFVLLHLNQHLMLLHQLNHLQALSSQRSEGLPRSAMTSSLSKDLVGCLWSKTEQREQNTLENHECLLLFLYQMLRAWLHQS